MDVVLLQDIEKVGLRGEVVSVSPGYMRNFLQPAASPSSHAAIVAEIKASRRGAPGTGAELDQAQAIAET
jgi:ribosomal protein L9